jgi:hypothetical protein
MTDNKESIKHLWEHANLGIEPISATHTFESFNAFIRTTCSPHHNPCIGSNGIYVLMFWQWAPSL